jgi:hypothetical protein
MEFAFIFGNQYSIAVTSFHFVPLRQHVRPVLESNHEFNEAPVISNALSLSFRAKREILVRKPRFLSRSLSLRSRLAPSK